MNRNEKLYVYPNGMEFTEKQIMEAAILNGKKAGVTGAVGVITFLGIISATSLALKGAEVAGHYLKNKAVSYYKNKETTLESTTNDVKEESTEQEKNESTDFEELVDEDKNDEDEL